MELIVESNLTRGMIMHFSMLKNRVPMYLTYLEHVSLTFIWCQYFSLVEYLLLVCIILFWSWTLFEILHCVSHRPLPILAWLQYHPQNDSWISLEKEYVYNLFIIVPKTEGFPQTQIASAHKYLPQPLPWWRWSEGSVERLCQSFGRRPVNDHKSNAVISLTSL